MQPKWRIRPGEPTEWQNGTWRWRSSIPSGYSQQFDEIMLNFTRGDETLADRRASIAVQARTKPRIRSPQVPFREFRSMSPFLG